MKTKDLLVFLLLAVSIQVLQANALPGSQTERPLFAPDKVKIQLTADAYRYVSIQEEMYAEAESFNIEELDNTLSTIGVKKINRAHRKVKDTSWETETGFDRWFVLTVPSDTDILKTIEFLKTNPFVESAIPEGYFYPDYIPNDLYYANNWGHNNTVQFPSWVGSSTGSHSGPLVGTAGFDSDAQNAWDDTQGLGTASIIIAIIDTGVDVTHPDLRLVPGYDFGCNDSNPMPEIGTEADAHGTSCAGIASAIGNNSIGAVGIAAGCSVMPLKVTNSDGLFLITAVINALTYAGDHNVDVISMSFGYSSVAADNYTLCEQAIDYAYNHGSVLFASMGNSNSSEYHYPAWSSKVIGVGAASPGGERKSTSSCDGEYWWGSNWGSDIPDNPGAVDIMAPTILPTTDIMGANGYSTSNYYMWFNGTSCACPYAAGVAALILSKYPTMSQASVRSRLIMSATDMTLDGGIGWDRYTGYGMVNAAHALGVYDYVWTGAFSTNWSDYRNWEVAVPNSSSDVQILPVEPGCFYPNINSANASCKSLTVFAGASLTVGNFNLTIAENLVVYGSFVQTGSGDVTVNGYVVWGNGSTANMTAAGAEMYVKGHMYFRHGSNVQMTNGTIEFFGDNSSGIYVNETARMYNLRSNKNVGAFLGTSPTSDHDLYIHGNFTNMTDRVFKHQYPGTIHLKGNFTNNILGAFWFNDGSISFEGSSNQSFTNNSTLTSYFNHVDIATSNNAIFSLNDDIEVRGSLNINSGIFQCNNNDIYLRGNWINNVSEAAFIEGDGAVIINGTSNQYLVNEHFGTIDLNKTSGEMIILAGSIVTCDKYNWTAGVYRVTGGTFTVALRLVQPGICGTIYLDSGTINYHQGPEDRNDFNGTLYINGGSFNMYGGSDDCYWAGTANASLYMTGGVFDFKDKSIVINNFVTVLTLDIQGGTIRTVGDYKCLAGNRNLNGGTLELYGPNDGMIYIAPTSSVFNLNINKSSGRNERDNAVGADSNLLISGNLTITYGTFDVRLWNLQVNGNITVYGILKKNSAGSIVTYGDFVWQNGSVSDITAGTIQCNRHWRFYSGCTVNLSSVTTTLNASQPAEITASSPTAWFGTLNLGVTVIDISTFTLVEESTDALIVKGPLAISGAYTLRSEGIPIKTENGVTVNSSCKLSLGQDAILRLKIGTSLTINSGGTLEVIGSAGHPATITNLTTGYYYFNVESGATISAEYGIFEYMQQQGVNVKYGALVDATHSFHYCTFRNGYSNQKLMTIGNIQTFTVYGANFPTSITTSLYNVYKNQDLGIVTFVNATGAFSGQAFESDPYNRINWTYNYCDLSINDYWTISDQLYVCEENSYGIEIYNSSAYSTLVPIRVDLYYNRQTMPIAGEIGDEYIYIDPLGAGEAISFELLAVPSFVPGIWKTWFRIDTLNEITETNENNNADGYVETEWLPLPEVQNLNISYSYSTQTVHLNWTYPTEPAINRFKVYRSENPMGPFDTLVGTPTSTSYVPLVIGTKYFYQVRAEKTWP